MAEQEKRSELRLSNQDAAQLGDQIAGLTRAGLALPSGLRALRAELPPGRQGRMLDALATSLEEGLSLDKAIATQGRMLPAHLSGLVKAGERTGRTGEILGRFAGYAQIGADVRRQLWLSLAYPIIATVLAVAVLLFVLRFIVGGFDEIFRDFGIAIPTVSWFLIAVANALGRIELIQGEALAAIAASFLVTLIFMDTARRRSLAGSIPLLGPVWRWTSLAEFSHLLGLLLESELPLVEAVPMAGQGVADLQVRNVARSMTGDLERGDSLAAAIGRRPFFPEGLGQIMAWAEKHQSMPGALHMLAEMFEGRARAQAHFVGTICNVLTVLAILGGIAAVIGGVMIPMIQLIQKLSG
jgi:general secretion pathway protein F